MKSIPSINTIELSNYISNNNFKIVFLDEIQEIKGWSDFAQALIDSSPDTRFIMASSNTRVLTRETMLNRVKVYILNPLNYAEYKQIWKDKDFEKFSNSFGSHLSKNIDKYYWGKIKDGPYYNSKFKFGIGIFQSWENYISKVGHGVTKELIYVGNSVNYANLLAKKANRGNNPKILMNNLIYDNFTDEETKRIQKIGGFSTHYISGTNSTVYGCNWIITNYNNFVENNV